MIVSAAGQVQVCKFKTDAILHPSANISCVHHAKTALMYSVYASATCYAAALVIDSVHAHQQN